MEHRGVHLLSDVVGADGSVMSGACVMLGFMKGAASRGGATVVSEGAVDLTDPPGFTVFVGLDESHLSAHYYAEGGHLAVDVFTCGFRADARAIMREVLGAVGGEVVFSKEVARFPQETGGETEDVPREGRVDLSVRESPGFGAASEGLGLELPCRVCGVTGVGGVDQEADTVILEPGGLS